MISKLFKAFFQSEKTGGIILLVCTVMAMLIANSAPGEAFTHWWHQHTDLSFANIRLDYSREDWVNDGLMTIFFLLVGLEIKRELYRGELKSLKNAALPVAAAVGGMLVPALIYFLVNFNSPGAAGFGIPMATDIAFALGMLSLLGSRVPHSLKIFLTALAIIDDLGAILVIAIFYNTGISLGYLSAALGIFLLLLLLSKLKINKLAFYLLPGIVMWYCMLQSGVHATITGVLLAFTIPMGAAENNLSDKLQHALHKPVAFIILPLFALANTALMVDEGWINQLTTTNNLGIIAGLVIGKPLGIILFAMLLIKLKWGQLPDKVTALHIVGAGVLAGIGFTMSIFISNLAYASDPSIIKGSKIAVLVASSAAAVTGLAILWLAIRKKKASPVDI